MQGFIILASIRQKRCTLAVNKEVIHLQGKGGDPAGQHLDGKAFGGGGFAAGGWARDQDHTHILAPVLDHLGHRGDLHLVQCLGDQDHLIGMAFLDCVVERPNGRDAKFLQPGAVLPECTQQIGVTLHFAQPVGGCPTREAQDERGIAQPLQGESTQVARGGHHVAVMVVPGF